MNSKSEQRFLLFVLQNLFDLKQFALRLAVLIVACTSISGVCVEKQSDASLPQLVASSTSAFLVFGDSGYAPRNSKKSGLTPVANAMKLLCQTARCQFALMAGDNIYPKGADGDPASDDDTQRFKKLFIDPFGTLGVGDPAFRIYATLGNHDWYNSRRGALAQVAFLQSKLPFYMNDFFYSVRPPSAGGKVEIFVIDTEILLAPVKFNRVEINDSGKPLRTNKKRSGGSSNALPKTDREKYQLSWLEQALKSSKADWKLVLGHHPLWESRGSKYGQAVALRKMLSPVLCKYADAYFAGHQHTLEVHEDSCVGVPERRARPLAHVISGAAAKSRKVNDAFAKWQKENHPRFSSLWAKGSVWGFTYVTVEQNAMTVKMFASKAGNRDPKKIINVFTHTFLNRSVGKQGAGKQSGEK